jgi:hypothetical protein
MVFIITKQRRACASIEWKEIISNNKWQWRQFL